MDEETKTEEIKTEATNANTTEGMQSETTSQLDRADQIAQMQKRENDRHEALIIRGENLEARRKVGGITQAGQMQEKAKEETPVEYKDRIQRGG